MRRLLQALRRSWIFLVAAGFHVFVLAAATLFTFSGRTFERGATPVAVPVKAVAVTGLQA